MENFVRTTEIINEFEAFTNVLSKRRINSNNLFLYGGATMPLTPLDIHNKSFSKGFRGYDEGEFEETQRPVTILLARTRYRGERRTFRENSKEEYQTILV